MSFPRRFLILCGLIPLAILPARAAVWQWSVSVPSVTMPDRKTHPRAFLWIPPDCRRVRAVVFGQYNMLEDPILQDPDFRRTLASLDMAEILVAPTFNTWQDTTNNDTVNKNFDALLQSLAAESGYTELQFAPIIPIGHSAMATFPWDFAAWNPERTLAILSVHGDAPRTHLTGNGHPNADWGDRDINGIPGLMVMGEYEWWEARLAPALAFEARYPKTPVAFFCDAGNGHFNSSKQLVDFLGMFIRKAAEWRLPDLAGSARVPRVESGVAPDSRSANFPSGKPGARAFQRDAENGTRDAHAPKLKPVDPRQGWLVDRWRRDQPPAAPPAPYAKYTGHRDEAFWCFDKEMAQLAERDYARQRGKLPQLTGFVQDGKVVPQNPKAFAQVLLKIPPLDNTLIFPLHGAFLDRVPPGNPEKWTGLTNDAPIGHATGGGPVVLSRITGPVKQLGQDTFAIRFNRLSIPADFRMGDIWLLASQPGDARYKSAVEQALMKIPFRLSAGAPQKITFPEIPDQKVGTKLLALNATSSAGAPVYYYVREGPAEVDGNVLRFTKIPPRAKFPVRVTVVAWQYGRTIEPKLQSAARVARTFYIVK